MIVVTESDRRSLVWPYRVGPLPSLPQGLLDIFGRLLALAFLAALATTLAVGLALALALALTFFSAFSLSLRLAFFSLSFFFAMVVLRSLEWGGKPEVRASLGAYFLRSLLCGLRLPMRPLSAPAAGSMTALIRVGLRESMAVLTARFSSSGVVTLTPTPPKAWAIRS